MAKISTTHLEQIFAKVIGKLKHDGVDEIVISTDYYRFIPTDEWEDFKKDTILIGSLLDDTESLDMLIKNGNRPCTYVDFDRLASVLRAISQENNPV